MPTYIENCDLCKNRGVTCEWFGSRRTSTIKQQRPSNTASDLVEKVGSWQPIDLCQQRKNILERQEKTANRSQVAGV